MGQVKRHPSQAYTQKKHTGGPGPSRRKKGPGYRGGGRTRSSRVRGLRQLGIPGALLSGRNRQAHKVGPRHYCCVTSTLNEQVKTKREAGRALEVDLLESAQVQAKIRFLWEWCGGAKLLRRGWRSFEGGAIPRTAAGRLKKKSGLEYLAGVRSGCCFELGSGPGESPGRATRTAAWTRGGDACPYVLCDDVWASIIRGSLCVGRRTGSTL